MSKNTILIYFYSDYFDSFLNLYTSINDLGMLDSQNIYSILVYGDTNKVLDKSILDRFNKKIQLKCRSDLYGYFKGLESIDIESFDYFILMNSSCIGPILPSHFSKKNWEIVFTKELKKFGLISPIVELPPLNDNYVKELKLRIDLNNLKDLKTIPFAHSYFLVFNRMSIINILENQALPIKDVNRKEAVGLYERFITAILLNNDFRVKSFLYKYKEISFDKSSINNLIKKFLTNNLSENIFVDPEIPHQGNFGSDLHPYEVVFFKNIRFPHSHRGEKQSGISESNMDFLDNIIGLKRNKFLLGFHLPNKNLNLKSKINLRLVCQETIIKFKKIFKKIFKKY
ncbi:hypothetical protein OA098_03695 [Prochlorococcus sp. AH-736-B04]|nr:hypothetical protein [Prochlorococcus sp. AH-736-B04]